MISVHRAQSLVRKHSKPCGVEVKDLQGAYGLVLAEDIVAPIPLPIFDNAAMDGFAFDAGDTETVNSKTPLFLMVCGTIKAGDTNRVRVGRGEAYRIMTGAPIPMGANTVLPIEAARVQDRYLVIHKPIKRKHIHRQGEEIKKGDVAVKKSTVVGPAVVGLLAALGTRRVKVFKKPRVSVISTGNELLSSGRKLTQGKIHDSNLPMLRAALKGMRINPQFLVRADDDYDLLKRIARKMLRESDILVVTGGISVGEYDLAKKVFRALGVSEIFWKVSQKPGKPLYFGKRDKVLVFGLPGNPAAVFTSFYEYVFPALRRRMGFSENKASLERDQATLLSSVKPDGQRTLFLKAGIERNEHKNAKKIRILGKQGSHMISSFCFADALAVIPPGRNGISKRNKVLVHYLPEG